MRRRTDRRNGRRTGRVLSVLAAAAFALVMLLGMSVQVMAESDGEIPITGFDYPKAVTMHVGETKTISLDVLPADTTQLIYISWGSIYIPDDIDCPIDITDEGAGSYWDEEAWVEIEADMAGVCYLQPRIEIYNSDGELVDTQEIEIKLTIEKKKSGYRSVSQAYKELNKFRTTKAVWQWKPNNVSKKYFNTKASNKLKALKKRADLEKTAKKRAKELVKAFSHTRPNGKPWYTVYPKKYKIVGENIACGQRTAKEVTDDWIEEDYKYNGQGHRRNMLNKKFAYVGIACYEKNGYRYWVQCFGK